MVIENNHVVSIHYALYDITDSEAPQFLESSSGQGEMLILLGYKQMLPAVEEALIGHKKGDHLNVELQAKEAYGERKEDSTQRIPIKHLVTKGKLKPGKIVQVKGEKGLVSVMIVKVGRFNVDVDTNHPLAGKVLKFEIEIVEAREASEGELAHGHAHGKGGHEH